MFWKKAFPIVLGALCFSFVVPVFAQETADTRIAPLGFREILSEPGVTMWQKRNEYMQVISPHRGATLALLKGDMIPSDGVGTNFSRKDLRQWWKEWRRSEPDALTLANGQFFNTANPDKSPLAFSTKIDGIVYVGYGDESEYQNKKMLLRIGDRHATVEPFNDDASSLYDFPEANIIVGLKPDVSKQGNIRRGRTFVGTMANGNLLVFTTPAATQRYATRILTAFGAKRDRIMMLDGGGSTQLIHQGELLIPGMKNPTLRTLPLAIGVTKGE